MVTLRFLESSTLRLGGCIVVGVCGLILVGTGVGIGIDYLFAQSHSIGVTKAFLLRAEYIVAGIFLFIVGVAIGRKGSNTDAVTD